MDTRQGVSRASLTSLILSNLKAEIGLQGPSAYRGIAHTANLVAIRDCQYETAATLDNLADCRFHQQMSAEVVRDGLGRNRHSAAPELGHASKLDDPIQIVISRNPPLERLCACQLTPTYATKGAEEGFEDVLVLLRLAIHPVQSLPNGEMVVLCPRCWLSENARGFGISSRLDRPSLEKNSSAMRRRATSWSMANMVTMPPEEGSNSLWAAKGP